MIVATHDGGFHADEVFAIATLRVVLGQVTVLRSRHPSVLARADLRVDVGGRYDPASGDFDHHQRGGARPPRPSGVAYAAFGLVWCSYGPAFCGGHDRVASIVDERFVQVVDAHDHGIATHAPTELALEPVTISHVVAALNPPWDAPADAAEPAFERAVDLATLVLRASVEQVAAEERSTTLVRKSLAQRRDPRVLRLPFAVPWERVVAEHGSDVLFVVWPHADGTWVAQAVDESLGSFRPRRAFPEAWAGLRDAELSAVSGVADALFCHSKRFLVVAASSSGVELLLSRLL